MNAPGSLGFISMPGTTELIVIGVVALLIFGKRLPEVARSLGKGIVEFKKGIADVEVEVDRASSDYAADTTTEVPPAETGIDQQDDEYGDTDEDLDAEDVDGGEESDEDVGAEDNAQAEDPVDDSDTYTGYDAADDAAGSQDEAAPEETADDDLDRAGRDDAYPTD
jgi:sec-independent protein translocase protein TatA